MHAVRRQNKKNNKELKAMKYQLITSLTGLLYDVTEMFYMRYKTSWPGSEIDTGMPDVFNCAVPYFEYSIN